MATNEKEKPSGATESLIEKKGLVGFKASLQNPTPNTLLLQEIVPVGHTNAVSRYELKNLLGCTDRKMRGLIEQARHEGLIICNFQDGAGYFQPETIADIEMQLIQIEHRFKAPAHQATPLRRLIRRLKNEEI